VLNFFSKLSVINLNPFSLIYRYPACSPNGILPNGGLPKQYWHGDLPKQYRHGYLPKRHFAKSVVPQMVLG
jgi:hypothetical protein